MIRYLFSIGFVIGCMGLPLQAKGVTAPTSQPATPTKTKKTETKAVASSTPATPAHQNIKTATTNTSAKSTPCVASTSQARPTSIASTRTHSSSSARTESGGRLARLTAYWAGEGDYYTGHGLSSTGIHLHDGHCAVDPRIIPYGSVVEISGLGKYLAVDTGSAVISREAAREAAHTDAERNALVIDLFFESRRDGEHFAASGPKYASISWTSPTSVGSTTQQSHSLVAE